MVSASTLDGVLSGVPYQGIDFGYCGVDQETTKSFSLTNPSASSTVRYTILCEEKHYSVSSTSGKSTPPNPPAFCPFKAMQRGNVYCVFS